MESEEKRGIRGRDYKEKKEGEKNGVKEDDKEQREREIQYSGLACGNSDTVFMDVYLSASPPGSSHFPLGNSWSAGKTFLSI